MKTRTRTHQESRNEIQHVLDRIYNKNKNKNKNMENKQMNPFARRINTFLREEKKVQETLPPLYLKRQTDFVEGIRATREVIRKKDYKIFPTFRYQLLLSMFYGKSVGERKNPQFLSGIKAARNKIKK